MTWSINASAILGYNLYRGAQADLPNLLTGTPNACIRWMSLQANENTASGLSDDPSAIEGRFYWYLVTGFDADANEGSAGNATAEQRIISSQGTCMDTSKVVSR